MITATTVNYKAGDRVTVRMPNQPTMGERCVIEQATDKAIKINGQWFPKSAFLLEEGFDNKVFATHLEVKSWFSRKMTRYQERALGILI